MPHLYIYVEYSLSKMLGTRVFQILDFGGILEYWHIHNEICWGWGPSLNIKFIYVSYTPYTYSLKIIFYAMSLVIFFLSVTCHMKSGVDFPLMVSCQCSQSFKT
jgi:hypothetical protein